MILGRAIALWQQLVSALAVLAAAVILVTGGQVNEGLIASVVAVVMVALGIVANERTPGAVATFARRVR